MEVKGCCWFLITDILKILFVFNRRKKLIQVWNNMRVNDDRMFFG